jgi:hypothetical protein
MPTICRSVRLDVENEVLPPRLAHQLRRLPLDTGGILPQEINQVKIGVDGGKIEMPRSRLSCCCLDFIQTVAMQGIANSIRENAAVSRTQLQSLFVNGGSALVVAKEFIDNAQILQRN